MMLATTKSKVVRKSLKTTEPHRGSQENDIAWSQSSSVAPSEFHANANIDGSHTMHKSHHVEKQARKTEVLCGEWAAPSTGSGQVPTGLIIALTASVQFMSHDSKVIGDKSEGHQVGADDPMCCGVGELLVGSEIKKEFGDQIFMGKVVSFDSENNWYKVEYEDGDEEDLEWTELKPIMLHSDEAKSTKRKKRNLFFTPRKPRRFKQSGRSSNPEARRVKGRSREHSDPVADQSFVMNEKSEEKENITGGRSLPFPGSADNLSSPAMAAKKRAAALLFKIKNSKEEDDTAVIRHASCLGGNKEAPKEKVHHTSNSIEFASDLSDRNGMTDSKPDGEGMRIMGCKIRKDFGGQSYDGHIIDYDQETTYYKVQYEDGDVEELEWSEVEANLLPAKQKCLSFKYLLRARRLSGMSKLSCEIAEDSKHHVESMQELFLYDGKANSNGLQEPTRSPQESDRLSHVKDAEVEPTQSSTYPAQDFPSPHLSLAAGCFTLAMDPDKFEYFCWGEVSGYNKAKRPELQATKLLPTSFPILHLAASHHHLVAITTSGQVWLWRNRHGNVHSRCNEWEHIACLEGERVVLADISGPDIDRTSSGYEPDQEDQVPDPFYLVAVTATGEDYVLHGSQPQDLIRTYHFSEEPVYCSLNAYLLQNNMQIEDASQVVQISVGTVEALDESPFVGYITDTDCIYIRSSTNDYTEEINLITGYTGRPLKIQCGRTYHAIIMTDDGHAWTWGCGHYPGIQLRGSLGFSATSCQPAVGTLVGRKVIDVGCYGDDFVALTSDGEVHQWTHGVPSPSSGVYNVPTAPLVGQGPCVAYGDKLVKVYIGVGMCSGVTESRRVHTWRTALTGGFMGMPMPAKEALTPLGREESHNDTLVRSLGNWEAMRVICVAGSLIIVVRKKSRD